MSQNGVSVSADMFAVVNLQFLLANSEAPVAAPVINFPGGTFTTGQAVTITTSTAGASIRYTTDGSAPTDTNGNLYNGAVPIPASATLKAIAFEPGMADSGVVSAAFTTISARRPGSTPPGAAASVSRPSHRPPALPGSRIFPC